jgi:hypothetical protein
MKILTSWLRTYVPNIPADDQQLAADLTLRGIAVEGVHSLGPGNGHLFETDITTNRVDAMNHYGIAREAATIYNLPLAPLISEVSSRPERSGGTCCSLNHLFDVDGNYVPYPRLASVSACSVTSSVRSFFSRPWTSLLNASTLLDQFMEQNFGPHIEQKCASL